MDFVQDELDRHIGGVVQLKQTLYHSNNDNDRKLADKWLVDFSETRAAWEAAVSLLLDSDLEHKFFGASLLARKVKEGWAQLSEGEQTQVYRNCLSQAVSGCSFPHPIVEQLTTAVACAVLRLIRNVPAVIDDLFVLLTNPPEEVDPRLARMLGINIIGRIPEEFDNLKLSFNHSSEIKKILSTKIQTVLSLTGEILKQVDDEFSVKFKQRALTCCLHWTNIGINLTEMIRSSIVDQIFENLANSQLFEEISDLLLDILTRGSSGSSRVGFKSARETTSNSLAYLLKEDPKIVQYILGRLLWTRSVFEPNAQNNVVACRQLATLISGVGEANINFFNPENTTLQMEFMKYLIFLASHPISELTFTFWTLLEKEEAQSSTENMKNIFFLVLTGVLNNCTRNDEEQDFYRKRADRVFKSSFRVLGENYIQFLMKKFQTGSWTDKEVCLHALSSVHSLIPPGQPAVTSFMDQISVICENNIQHDTTFITSCSTFLGKYSPWIESSNTAGIYLQFLLRYLSNSNSNSSSDAISATGNALKLFCTNCRTYVGPHLEEVAKALIPFIRSNTQRNSDGPSSESSRRSVISGICLAVYTVTDSTRGRNIIQTIAEPICNNIVEYTKAEKFDRMKEEISCIASIFSPNLANTTQITPIQVEVCLGVCEPVFNLLSSLVTTKYPESDAMEETYEAICEVIHSFLEGTRENLPSSILHSITSVLTQVFNIPTASGLKSTESIIKYHLRTQETVQFILPFLAKVFGMMFEKMKVAHLAHPNEIILEDFFSLLTKILQSSPDVLLASEGGLVLSLVSASVFCLGHPFIELQKSVLTFLELLFFGPHTRNGNWQKLIMEALNYQRTGVGLMSMLIQNLVYGSGHFKLIQLQSSLLHKFVFSPLREQSLKFLVESFNDPKSPFNSEIFTEQDKHNILNILAKTEAPRLFKMLIKDLAEVTNGLQTIDALGNYF